MHQIMVKYYGVSFLLECKNEGRTAAFHLSKLNQVVMVSWIEPASVSENPCNSSTAKYTSDLEMHACMQCDSLHNALNPDSKSCKSTLLQEAIESGSTHELAVKKVCYQDI
jgi:hypothetical protein